MNEIQSISQSNYILHNIDAKKLYVQEPLFTANSGDAVYVGWRPDETVLWSGTLGATGTYISFSEDVSGFERLKLFGVAKTNSDGRARTIGEYEVNYNKTDNNCLIYFPLCNRGTGTTTQNLMYVELSGNSAHLLAGDKWVGSTYTNNVSTYDFNLVKVVGVNRKENA